MLFSARAFSAVVSRRRFWQDSRMPETRILHADDEEMKPAVAEAVRLLAGGEIVALPTETVYGLAADAFCPEAVARVFAAKERPEFDPLIVHIHSQRDLERVALIPEDCRETVDQLASAFWPGPLTMVLPKHPDVPDLVTSGLPTVAVRRSAHPVFRAVLKALGQPLAAPSANRFGRISPTSASAVLRELEGRIPLIIDGGACREGLESTIVAIEPRPGKKPILRLHRSGPITREQLQTIGKVEKPLSAATGKPVTPGQLASHYAPRTPLQLLERPEDFQAEPGKRYALLSYTGEPDGPFVRAH